MVFAGLEKTGIYSKSMALMLNKDVVKDLHSRKEHRAIIIEHGLDQPLMKIC
jgi:hypothetical protein